LGEQAGAGFDPEGADVEGPYALRRMEPHLHRRRALVRREQLLRGGDHRAGAALRGEADHQPADRRARTAAVTEVGLGDLDGAELELLAATPSGGATLPQRDG